MGEKGLPPDPEMWSDGVMADSPTTTRTTGLHGVPLTVGVPAHVPAASADAAAPLAGVVVIQEAFGVAPSLVGACERLARRGYVAVAPHLYHRTASEPFDDFAAAAPHMRKLRGEDIAHDIADARGYLDAAGVAREQLGIVGFCMGGTIALWQATSGDFAAAVTFYGGGIAEPRWPGVPAGLEAGAGLRCPWLGLYGDLDTSITVDQVEELRAVTAKADYPTSIVRYPDAGHAFANDPASPRYVAQAAVDSWARALDWFDAHLR